MKNKNLKLGSIAYLLFFMFFTGTIFAQNAYNLTGTFEGLRSQFDKSHKRFTKEFQYSYELVQKGSKVEGISTIISEEGNYAEVGIRGVVIKDKFYFEEFSMLDQIKAKGMVWCYKSGVLHIEQKDNQIILSGETPSYMVNYGYACSGGYTKIYSTTENTDVVSKKDLDVVDFQINLYPNPTTEYATLSFNIEDKSSVKIEILDLSGKIVFKNVKRNVEKGNFSENISLKDYTPGLYIVKIKTNNKVFSKEVLKIK